MLKLSPGPVLPFSVVDRFLQCCSSTMRQINCHNERWSLFDHRLKKKHLALDVDSADRRAVSCFNCQSRAPNVNFLGNCRLSVVHCVRPLQRDPIIAERNWSGQRIEKKSLLLLLSVPEVLVTCNFALCSPGSTH